MEFSPDQLAALGAVETFVRNGRSGYPQFLTLQGLAGTGKTTVLAELARRYPAATLVAPTGKAAAVLRSKTDRSVSTIHSAIYDFQGLRDDEHTGERRPVFSSKDETGLGDALVLLDECFAAGTMIGTPLGWRRIEHLCAGDEILNAVGVDRVVNVARNRCKAAVAQVLCRGETLTVSEDHRFFTERGLVRARDLRPGDRLPRQAATVRLLREALHPQGRVRSVLHDELWNALERSVPRVASPLHDGHADEGRRGAAALAGVRSPEGERRARARSQLKTDERPIVRRSDETLDEGQIWQDLDRRQRSRTDPGAASSRSASTEFRDRARGVARPTSGRLSDVLQARPSVSRAEDRDRAERLVAPNPGGASERRQEAGEADFARVDGVVVLERGDPRLDRFRSADGELYLYDLEAARHHSFSVHGVLVHNCSMVGTRLARDLLATGARVVACGDPGQLPPVADEQFFDRADVALTQVHRQALESPIVRQAHAIRHTGRYAADGPDFRVIARASEADLAACSVALCWRNRTRRLLNVKRRRVLGFDGPTLSVGEPVMCLKNDHALRVYNGEVGAVAVARAPGEPLAVTTPDGRVVTARSAVVEAVDPDYETARHEEGAQPFALAYGLTVHKAQGSEFESVLLIDECNRSDERARFLYTGVTRAQRRATIVPWR